MRAAASILTSHQLASPSIRESELGEMGRTLVLVNLASIMERADEALLPAVYKEVGAALHTTPTGLGTLTLCRSIVQGACYPLAAYASARYNRAHVIAVGAFLWAAATFFVAISETFLQIAISRGLNGIGLALVIPAVQSLVADSTDDEHRGMAFGWLQLTSSIGSILGGICALLLAPTTIFGIAGWRFAFHLVAAISVVVGVLVWFFAVDPNFRTVQAAPALGVGRGQEAAQGGQDRHQDPDVPDPRDAGRGRLLPVVGDDVHGHVAGARRVQPRGHGPGHGGVRRRPAPGWHPRRQDRRRPRQPVPERREDRCSRPSSSSASQMTGPRPSRTHSSSPSWEPSSHSVQLLQTARSSRRSCR